MGAITVYAKTGIVNWNDPNGWNSLEGGGGTDYTNPQNGGGNTYICDLNGKAVTLNVDVTVDQIREDTANGTLTTSGTRTINVSSTNGIYYSGTATTGMILAASGTSLTINGQVTSAAVGTAIRAVSGSPSLAVNNVGGVACKTSSNGRCVSWETGGALTINGDIQCTGIGYCLFLSGAATCSLGGNIAAAAAGYVVYFMSGTLNWTPGAAPAISLTGSGRVGIRIEEGTLNINGDLTMSISSTDSVCEPIGLVANGSVLNWLGDRSLPAGYDCLIRQHRGTVNLATAAGRLNLANSSSFVLERLYGTLNVADLGAGPAQIVNQNAASYAAMIGATDDQKAIIQQAPQQAPDTPTLVMVDKADGTGATATISDGDPLATNTVKTSPIASPSWTVSGSRVGNGTVNLALSVGFYWGYVESVLGGTAMTVPVWFAVTDGTDPVAIRCLDATAAGIQALGLSGSPAVVKQKFPWNAGAISPGIFLSLVPESVTPATNQADDIGYGVLVTMIRASNHNLTIADGKTALGWREAISAAFRSKPLAGVSEVYTVRCEPASVFWAEGFKEQYDVSALVLRCVCRKAN